MRFIWSLCLLASAVELTSLHAAESAAPATPATPAAAQTALPASSTAPRSAPTPTPALPAAWREAGLPFFDVFAPRDYRGHGQVWTVAEDRAGVLYFGNLGRILIYDGARWSHLTMPGTTYVRALAIDAEDTLWIGAVDELGYAKTDANGQRVFVSLKEKLPGPARNCGEIWKVFLTPHGPLFQTSTWLMRWNGHHFTTLKLPEASSWQLVQAGDRLLLNQSQLGFLLVSDDGQSLSMSPTPQPDILKKRGLTFSLPGDQPGTTILGSGRTGLIRWDGTTGQLLAPELSAETAKNILYGGARLADGRLVLTTLQNGAYLADAQGRLLAHLNQKTGLPSNTVINVFADRSGSVWLCLDQGLVRVDARPWLTWFSSANGAPRAVLTAPVRFAGTSYLATGAGLMKLVPAGNFQPARLEPVEGFTDFLNQLVVAGDELIGLGVQGLFTWRPGRSPVALPGKAFNANSFVPSQHQPGRWFAIADGNLYTFRRDGGAWIEEGTVPGLQHLSGLHEQPDGTWWFGASQGGALRVAFPHATATSPGAPTVETFSENAGLPANHGWVRVAPLGDRVLFHCNLGVFRLDPVTQRIAPTAELGARFSDGTWTPRSLARDPAGGFWIAARRVGEIEISGPTDLGFVGPAGWQPMLLPQGQQLNDTTDLHIEPANESGAGDTLWIGGHSGLVRVDLDTWRRTPPPAPPLVTVRAITRSDGALLPLVGNWELPFVSRTFTVNFAAPAGRNVTYESTLSGSADALVQTDATPQRVFTGLSSGHYRLALRARNEGGDWSQPVTLNFYVQPPWWFSAGAWAGYVVIAALLVTAFVTWRTRALRRRNEQLEAIVAERTRELEKLRQLEIDEKIAAKLGEEKARLEVLRYQLNPHFLFNALTSVCAHLPPNLSKARAIIEQLVDFCQLTLFRPAGGENPTMVQEMKMLRAYLDIEQTRWGDLLKVELDVDDAAAHATIPPLLLLPLVENALKYGRATARGALTIRLRAFRDAVGALRIEVANTGEWVEATQRGTVPSLGIGLENLRQRLQRYYPSVHEFTHTAADGWVTFSLSLHATPREI